MQRAINNLHGVSPVCATVTRDSTNTNILINNNNNCNTITASTAAISPLVDPHHTPTTSSCPDNSNITSSVRYQLYKLGVRSLWLSILLAAGAYLWYVAAGMTSSATLTAIYNASCCFVYVFSVLFFGEAIRFVKVLAVLLSIGGVTYMSFADSYQPNDSTKLDILSTTSHNDTFVGDLVALGSAIIVGLYQVMYRHYAVPKRHNSLHFVNTMVGLMGAFTLFVCWIPIPILHWIDWERFEWPDVGSWGWIVVIAICGILYNICYTFVIALISPLFASVGIMLTIPIVALTDWLLQGKTVTSAMVLGSTGILVGFGLLISTSWKEEATYRTKSTTKLLDDTEDGEHHEDEELGIH
jgi:drug/metabolite transporter (DMT)-like permease